MKVLILLKPDAFERRHVGLVMEYLESSTDFEITEARLYHSCIPTALKLTEHYAEHHGKPFYDGLMEFMNSGKILALAGTTASIPKMRNATTYLREMLADGGPRNVLHCSDSPEAAERECNIWFPSS